VDTTLFTFFQTQGPWALLFVMLFYWTLKEHKRREQELMSYNQMFQKALSDLVVAITEMRHDISDLKDVVSEMRKG
jgi:hypothetical protein